MEGDQIGRHVCVGTKQLELIKTYSFFFPPHLVIHLLYEYANYECCMCSDRLVVTF